VIDRICDKSDKVTKETHIMYLTILSRVLSAGTDIGIRIMLGRFLEASSMWEAPDGGAPYVAQ
jgi:hypothetical protein